MQAREYKRYGEFFARNKLNAFKHVHSRKFRTSQDLIKAGILRSIDWEAKGGGFSLRRWCKTIFRVLKMSRGDA